MQIRTAFGVVELEVWRGKNPGDGKWGCPMRGHWGLSPHQQLSPALEDKLAYFATVTGSYEMAAKLAAKVGCPVEDSTIHRLVQRLGARAEEQMQARLRETPMEKTSARAATPLAVLMLDGFQVRHRGPGWGKKKTVEPRVEWHEMKVGVFYRQEQSVQKAGRGQLNEKVVVSWQGEPMEIGRRLHWEARRGGLGRAESILAVADGAPWIWAVVDDRWRGCHQLLDFYHASQHLWILGEVCSGSKEAAGPWVEKQLHNLRHGKEKKVLREIAELKNRSGKAREIILREKNYFAGHAQRMNYGPTADRGWPIGSGTVESACAQKQCRRKRPGQFWTRSGLRHLDALEEARDNGYWDQLWLAA